jgi:putative transposase
MRKRRVFVEGAIYHVTSRTNNKIKVFEKGLGRKIMLVILKDAKEKYGFQLPNFCVMPTHIHLLIKPADGTNLARIMQWIKTKSAKYWNHSQGLTDHMWGERFYSRVIKNHDDFETVMDYIDQNPVKAGLVAEPADWLASGAYYRKNGLLD